MTAEALVARWHHALLAALATSLLAVALGVPALLFLSILALGFVLAETASGTPAGELRLERSLSSDRPRPGEVVTVSLTLTNEGSGVAADVRVVDDPPSGVAVVGGTPAFATALRPGESTTVEYDLAPPRGTFTFGAPTVRRRNAAATGHVTESLEPTGASAVDCETLLDAFPVHDRAIRFVGRTPTDDGGSGVEFYATRKYRRGDPVNRIDWHRYARTGDLATVEYREERAVTVVFVVDDREGSRREPLGGGPDAVDLSLYAASRGVVASLEAGHRAGYATLAGEAWVDPGDGDDVRARVDAAIGREDATGPRNARTGPGEAARPDGGRPGDDLVRRLPADAQVVLCTPLTDAHAVAVVRRLRSLGRAVTVVSPDLETGVDGGTGDARSADAETGARIAGFERANRIADCRALGATVVDWDLGEPLSVDLARALRTGGWSR